MTIGEQQEWLRRHLDRHRVSRRTALRGGASVLAALGATTAPWALAGCAQAASAPGRRRRAAPVVRGRPDPADGGRGRAHRQALGPVVVDVGADTGYGQTIEAEVRELVSMVPQQDGSIRAPTSSSSTGSPTGSRRAPRSTTGSGWRTARRPRTRRSPPPPTGTALGAVHLHRVRRPGRQRRPGARRADRLQRQLLRARRHPPDHGALGRDGGADRGPAPGVPPAGGRHLLRRPQRQRAAR